MSAPNQSPLDTLLQLDFREYVEKSLGKEKFLPVLVQRKAHWDVRQHFLAIGPSSEVSNRLRSYQWDVHPGKGGPHVVEYHDVTPKRIVLEKPSSLGDDFIPLAYLRDFGRDDFPPYTELLEDFRLFYNLFHDAPKRLLFHIDEDGDATEVAQVGHWQAYVRNEMVRHFAQLFNGAIALYFVSDRYSTVDVSEIPQQKMRAKYRTADTHYEFFIDNAHGTSGARSLSRVIGKKFITPPHVGISENWRPPMRREYCDYWILDPDGQSVLHSCDPDALADFFGKNPGAPNFLTPVYFTRDVLLKYHGQPEKYSVGDGFVQCGSLWQLRIDNNHSTRIVAFLGDLGALSHKEQSYWKGFNVESDGEISRVEYQRSVMAEPTDAEAVDLVFKETFLRLRAEWQERHEWPLFLDLEADDEHYFSSLRRPLTDSQAEFDQQVLALTKVLVDSINEAEIASRIVDSPENAKSIKKLELFLKAGGYARWSTLVEFFKLLQGLRSTGVAHRKGKNYRKLAKDIDLDGMHLSEEFEKILQSAAAHLNGLRAYCRTLSASAPKTRSSSSGDSQ